MIPATPQDGLATQSQVEVGKSLQPRRRIELLAGLGISGGGSNWATDGLGYATVFAGLRFYEIIAPFGMIRQGYGHVDQRLLTFLALGLQVGYHVKRFAWPYARLAFVHQHEESLAAVAEQPFGTLLGIGVGIRHRAGFQASLGCDFVLYRSKRGELTFGPEAMVAYMGYSTGPNLYGTAGVQLGGSVFLY